MLIDEWQIVPDVLGAVKRAVDERPGPGRFVIAGSTQADLTVADWAATGRLIRAEMYGLTEREIEGRATEAPLLDRIVAAGFDAIALPAQVPDLRGYVARAAAPGPADARHLQWLRSSLGPRFALGMVFHTGPRPLRLDDDIWAVPICALWS